MEPVVYFGVKSQVTSAGFVPAFFALSSSVLTYFAALLPHSGS